MEKKIATVVHSCVCFGLRRLTRDITRLYDKELRPARMKSTQFTLLTAIAFLGPVSMGALARSTGLEASTLSRSILPLKRRGWIDAKIVGDSRVRILTITSEGKESLMAALLFWEKAQKKVRGHLGPVVWANLTEALNALSGQYTGEKI
jgi:DNA-binding MarR family transcriptional regulator